MTLRRRVIAIAVATGLLFVALFAGVRNDPPDPALAKIPKSHPSLPAEHPAAQAMSDPPVDELRAAIDALCTGEARPTNDSSPDTRRELERLEPFEQWQQRLLDTLAQSSLAEHLHFAALVDSDPASRSESIRRAVSLDPNDAFTLWTAVHVCADERETADCPLRDWERRLLQVDGENSESWLRVAANRYADGNLDSALEALRRASASAETRAYWTETIEMAERGYAVIGDRSFPERAAMAFGVAASNLPNVGDYVNMCKAQSAASVEWAYACLAYGETAEKQGKTEVGVSIGLAIQLLALEALGELEELAEVEQRKEARANQKRAMYSENRAQINELMISTPALFASYLAAIRTYGEFGAQSLFADEVQRLLQDEPNLACLDAR